MERQRATTAAFAEPAAARDMNAPALRASFPPSDPRVMPRCPGLRAAAPRTSCPTYLTYGRCCRLFQDYFVNIHKYINIIHLYICPSDLSISVVVVF